MEIVDRRVPLLDIGKTVGPSPTSRFVRNVRKNGVIMPVLLREAVSDDGSPGYRIVDGNRRVAAARRSRHRDVPARILVDASADEVARITLATNIHRSNNHVTEFWAIKHLERSGVNRQRIATEAGLTKSMLAMRERLLTLDRRVFVGFAEGKVSPTVALSISRMPRDSQRTMGDLFAESGRILTRDVRALSERSRQLPRTDPHPPIDIEARQPDADTGVLPSRQPRPPLENFAPERAQVPRIHPDMSPDIGDPLDPLPSPVTPVASGTKASPSVPSTALPTLNHSSDQAVPMVAPSDSTPEQRTHIRSSPERPVHPVPEPQAPVRPHADMPLKQALTPIPEESDWQEVPEDLRLAFVILTKQAINRGISRDVVARIVDECYAGSLWNRSA